MSHITVENYKKIYTVSLEKTGEKELFYSLMLPEKKIRYISSIKI